MLPEAGAVRSSRTIYGTVSGEVETSMRPNGNGLITEKLPVVRASTGISQNQTCETTTATRTKHPTESAERSRTLKAAASSLAFVKPQRHPDQQHDADVDQRARSEFQLNTNGSLVDRPAGPVDEATLGIDAACTMALAGRHEDRVQQGGQQCGQENSADPRDQAKTRERRCFRNSVSRLTPHRQRPPLESDRFIMP